MNLLLSRITIGNNFDILCCKKFGSHFAQNGVPLQCDQIGQFAKVLGNKFSLKCSPNI